MVELFAALFPGTPERLTPITTVTSRKLPGPARLNEVEDSESPGRDLSERSRVQRRTRFERQRPLVGKQNQQKVFPRRPRSCALVGQPWARMSGLLLLLSTAIQRQSMQTRITPTSRPRTGRAPLDASSATDR